MERQPEDASRYATNIVRIMPAAGAPVIEFRVGCGSLPRRRHDAAENVGLRLPDPGVVVGAGGEHDHQVEVRDHVEALATVAESSAPGTLRSLPGHAAAPPLITVLEPIAGIDVRLQ